MTYQTLIQKVSHELKDDLAWPDDATKLSEQLALLYAAVLSVATTVPAQRLETTQEPLSVDSPDRNGVYLYDLPDDLFIEREDLGIKSLRLGTNTYFPSQAVPYQSVIQSSNNSFHKGNVIFGFWKPDRKLFVNSDGAPDIHYVPTPETPTSTNYQTMESPLTTDDNQRAIHIVAMHVSGSQIRDIAGARFQALLAKQYNTV